MKIPKVCKNLRKIRLKLGYTQQEVADGLDYNRVFITRFETGKAIPNKRHIILFSNFYKVPVIKIDPDFDIVFDGRNFQR